MRIHFIWMAFISLLAIMLAIGAAVYDANYRTKYMPTEKSFQVQMIQGNKARLCALVSSGPRKNMVIGGGIKMIMQAVLIGLS